MGIKTKQAFRASRIIGITVENPEHDDIGEIEDVVIDLEDGDVAYAVLHFRAWFHDKLFAIPWRALTLVHDEDGRHFVLDTTREQLKSAPGFDPEDWPDVASNVWREKIETHYRKAS